MCLASFLFKTNTLYIEHVKQQILQSFLFFGGDIVENYIHTYVLIYKREILQVLSFIHENKMDGIRLGNISNRYM